MKPWEVSQQNKPRGEFAAKCFLVLAGVISLLMYSCTPREKWTQQVVAADGQVVAVETDYRGPFALGPRHMELYYTDFFRAGSSTLNTAG